MLPPLFPPPTAWSPTGGTGSLEPIDRIHDPTVPEQGYVLDITTTGTTVRCADAAGARYAAQTVTQLERADSVPAGRITDAPAMATRGYMLDISRDRVPTRDTLDWLVRALARLRINELQLYTEHTFAWTGHEEVWAGASPLTADDLAWLSARCADVGIDLVPCLNGFGHMERFLRHESYRHRAECPDGVDLPLWPGTRPPTTLAPTPDNASFVLGLFREYLAAAPSRLVHVGGDEPFELGAGRSADDVARRGRATVYLEHLRRIVDPLIADGHEVLFWGDVLRTAPDLVAQLPDGGLTAVVWHYEAPRPNARPLSEVVGPAVAQMLGMPEDGMRGFHAHTRHFVDTGQPFRVAPGTSTWNSLIGRWPNARDNISDAVRTGITEDAVGLLLTDWGDAGHHHPLVVSLPPMAWAAAAAWTGPDALVEDGVDLVVDEILDATGIGARLRALGTIHDRLGARAMNASPLCQALFEPVRVRPDRFADDDAVRAALAVLDDTASAFPGIRGAVELAAVCRLAMVGIERLAAAAGRPLRPEVDTNADLRDAVDLQRAAWRTSSRPGGLDDSLSRIIDVAD